MTARDATEFLPFLLCPVCRYFLQDFGGDLLAKLQTSLSESNKIHQIMFKNSISDPMERDYRNCTFLSLVMVEPSGTPNPACHATLPLTGATVNVIDRAVPYLRELRRLSVPTFKLYNTTWDRQLSLAYTLAIG